MTLLGVFFIPAALLCFLWRPFYLLPLLIVASVFEAGSVLNGAIGNFEFGVQPFYLVEVFIALRLVMLGLGLRKLLPRPENPVRAIVILVFLFWLWSFPSAFIMPHLFAGTLVSVPRNGGDAEFAPLVWNLSNLAQAGYVTLNVATVLYALHVVRTHGQTEQLMRALYWAAFVVVFVGFAQFLAFQAGWDFPYETFNSNPGYAMGFEEDIGSIHRFNSTFLEPSYAGSYLSAISCGLLASLLSGRRGIGLFLALLGAVGVLFLTTSTTGFAALAVGVFALVISFNPLRRHKETGKSSALGWTVFLVIFGLVGLVVLFNPDFSDAVLVGTFAKWETTSFWTRLANDVQAIRVFLDTKGLGVGLGSSRSSGLIFTMLSSVGIVGTALFAAVFYKIVKSFPGRLVQSSLQLTFWALLTLLVSEILSVPDISRPVLWGLLILVLTQLNVHFDPRPAKESAKKRRVVALAPPLQGASGVAPAN
jgi:hypothetical protein